MAEIEIHADGDFEEMSTVQEASELSNPSASPCLFEDDHSRIEFFYGERMQCPIDGCNVSHFSSKGKYQRHWDAFHVKVVVSYPCPVPLCDAACRRRGDLKVHLRNIHQITNNIKLEDELSKGKKEVKENSKFIDPGLFIFKGRTQPVDPTSSSSSAVPVSEPVVSRQSPVFTVTVPSTIPVPSKRPPLLPLPDVSSINPDSTSFTLTSRISLEEYRSRESSKRPRISETSATVNTHPGYPSSVPVTSTAANTHPGYPSSASETPVPENTHPGYPFASSSFAPENTHPGYRSTVVTLPVVKVSQVNTHPEYPLPSSSCLQESSTQTSARDLPPLVLPDIPTTQHELEAYLRWLCNAMDQIGRVRESAKQRLETLRKQTSSDHRFHQEREARRKLEAENRRLQRELAELKWRDQVFRNTEP